VRAFCETICFRDRVITAVLCSSGIRVGGLVDLKVEDYKRLDNGVGQIFVYSNDLESRYMALCSEEACDGIDKYLELRKFHGETITPKSPLFRDIYDPAKPDAVKSPAKIYSRALEDKFNALWNKSGLRQATHSKIYELKSLNEKRKFSRYRFKSVHCFRKFFKTQLVADRMPEAMSERLLGHGGTLVDNYYRTGNPASEAWQALVKEYQSHTGSLAIDEKYRRRSEVAQELEKHAAERETEIKDLKAEMARMQKQAEADRKKAAEDRERMNRLLDEIERERTKQLQSSKTR
jgi:integrase